MAKDVWGKVCFADFDFSIKSGRVFISNIDPALRGETRRGLFSACGICGLAVEWMYVW